MNKLSILACALTLAASAEAPAQNASAARPAPTPGQQSAELPAMNSMPQLCRMREQQILNLVRQIASRSQTAGSAQPQYANQTQQLIKTERELETSWHQLDCARILYGAR